MRFQRILARLLSGSILLVMASARFTFQTDQADQAATPAPTAVPKQNSEHLQQW